MKSRSSTLVLVAGTLAATSTAYAQPNVLIAAAATTIITDCRFVDVQTKLMGTGFFSSVDVFNANAGTPTLAQLQAYDAVLTWSNSPWSNATAMGDVLADYVDAGGGVVVGTFANASIRLAGRWINGNYEAIIGGSGQTQGAAFLGTVHVPAHPIMDGVGTFNGGSSSFRPTATALNPGAISIAEWSDGRVLVAENANGQVVDLAMYPPSSDCRSDFWASGTDGARLMANALLYVAGGGPCYPDCDTSTGVGVLDIFDFLCFGNRFAANDPFACDCDTTTGVGVCDIFDFLCFGNAFNAGCP